MANKGNGPIGTSTNRPVLGRLMQQVSDVELRPRAPEGDKPVSDVLIAGRPTGSPVSGSVLEAAVRWSLGWLLFEVLRR